MKKIILSNALIWAALIFIASFLLRNGENYDYIFAAMMIGFTLSNGLLYTQLKRTKTEPTCR